MRTDAIKLTISKLVICRISVFVDPFFPKWFFLPVSLLYMSAEFQIFLYRKNLEEVQEKFSSLYSAYETAVKELQNFHEEQKNKDRHNNAYHEVQARGFTEKIDGMTAQIFNLEEALAQKNKELNQLMENVKKLELENEAIAILKAQV
jgi:Septin family protein